MGNIGRYAAAGGAISIGVCVLLSGTASVLLRDKRKKKRTDSAWGRLPRLGRKRRE